MPTVSKKRPKKSTRTVLLHAENIWVRSRHQVLLENISLTLHRGKVVTIVGPNGAGKTTLLRALLGVMPISAGTLTRAPKLRLGYVPQKLNISPLMPITVARFLAMVPGVTSTQIDQALHQVEAAMLHHEPLQVLSGGELQRVLLARALLQQPDILLMDEPTQGMDINGQRRFYELLDNIRQTLKCGIVMVSHHLNMVMATTDEVLCIHRHVCCSGKPEQVANDPAFIKLFGVGMAESLGVYHHQHQHTHDHWDDHDHQCEHPHATTTKETT